jgi:hypothetical protein
MNLALNGAEAIGIDGLLTISVSERVVRDDDHQEISPASSASVLACCSKCGTMAVEWRSN